MVSSACRATQTAIWFGFQLTQYADKLGCPCVLGAPSHLAPSHYQYKPHIGQTNRGSLKTEFFMEKHTYLGGRGDTNMFLYAMDPNIQRFAGDPSVFLSTPKVVLPLSKLVGAFCALFESDNVLADKREMSILYQMLTKAPETGLTPSAYSLPWSLYSWRESHKPIKKAIRSVHQKT